MSRETAPYAGKRYRESQPVEPRIFIGQELPSVSIDERIEESRIFVIRKAAEGGVAHYNRVHPSLGSTYYAGTVTATVGRVRLKPIIVNFEETVDRLAYINRAANGNLIAGIYEDNGDTPAGGSLVKESASVACVLGVQEVAVTDTSLTEGLYWLAYIFDDVTAQWARSASTNIIEDNATLVGKYYDRAGGYGALTDPCPAVATDNNNSIISYMRVKSVP